MFFSHPTQVCMTYFEHCQFSLHLGFLFAQASFKAVVHAFLPDWYITSTTDTVNLINDKLKKAGCR